MRIAIIGCGYVGLITGVGFALKGHKVDAIDVSKEKVDLIKKKIPPFHEPGLKSALQKVFSTKKFNVTTDMAVAAKADVIFVCVGTPSTSSGSIDLSYLRQSISQLILALAQATHKQVLVIRSTVIPGTTETAVLPLLKSRHASRHHYLGLAANPEFLREGNALEDFLNPDRIVIGTSDQQSKDILTDLYKVFRAPLILTTPSAAEMIKYTSNTLLAVLISFSNEIARICERTRGVDSEEVFRALHLDRRLTSVVDGRRKPVGITSYLRPGCGYGGSCLPKDLRAMIAFAKSNKLEPNLLESALYINQSQPGHFVDLAEQWAGSLRGKKVAVLGLSFKEGTDDLRESPGLSVAQNVLNRGASVILSDPLVRKNQLHQQFQNFKFTNDPVAAFRNADVCLLTTSAPEFDFVEKMLRNGNSRRTPIVVDGRRALALNNITRKDKYIGIGMSLS